MVEEIQSNYLNAPADPRNSIASQVLNVSEAEEAVRLSQARLSAGAGTQLDVLQSQQQLPAPGADDRTPGALQLRRGAGATTSA